MRKILLAIGMIAALGVTACKEEQEIAAEPDAQPAATAEIAAPVTETVDTVESVTTSSAPAVTFPKTVYYQCGETFVQFTLLDDGKANMGIANVSYAMEQVIAASGTKYDNLGNPDTYLWSKGDKAMLRINGTDSPECVETSKPKPPAAPYRAQGNEPGWNIVIENGSITFVSDYGANTATYPVSADETANDVRTVTAANDTGSVSVTIENARCTDDMSGEAFAHSVTVESGDKTYTGCGKSLVRHVTWVLEDINNQGIIDNSHITLTFGAEGRLHGRSGCNSYNGGYSLEGETLNIDENMASTMMACIAEGMMEQEQKFLKTLAATNKITMDETGALVLTGNNGERLLFREATE